MKLTKTNGAEKALGQQKQSIEKIRRNHVANAQEKWEKRWRKERETRTKFNFI